MKSLPKVYILILNYNNWWDTIECLESVLRNNYANCRVIVVDNDSPNNSMDYIKSWAEGQLNVWTAPNNPLRNLSYPPVIKPIPYVYYTKEEAERGDNPENVSGDAAINSNTVNLQNPLIFVQTKKNLGFSGSNNVGIRYAIKHSADYIVLLNSDTVVTPSFLEELVYIAEQSKNAFVVGSVIADYYTGLTVFTNAGIDRILKSEMRIDKLNSVDCSWPSDRVCGAAMLMQAKKIKEHSLLLDESLFLYCEELDVSLRARKLNIDTLVAGKSKVYHKERRSIRTEKETTCLYYILRNRILLAKRFLSLRDKIIFWPLFIGARFIKALNWLTTGQWQLIAISIQAFRDGIKGKAGKL